jgi:DNA-binding transcriptional ArsR family regulator
MPSGLLVMHWNERVGVEVVAQYPPEVSINEKVLMQLYSQHEFTGEPGLVSLISGSMNLASFYTGKDTAVYVIVILAADEDGDSYEEGLGEMSRQILQNMDSGALRSILPSLFQRLSVYPTLNDEQRMSMLFQSDVKRMILKRLREELMIIKSEIAIWMRDEYRDGFIDLENTLSGLLKLGLIKSATAKGLTSDIIFLVEDLIMLRRPPVDLVKDPVGHHLPDSLKQDYITEVRTFFTSYVPSEGDSLSIIEKIILHPQAYEVLKLLREAIVTKNDIEKLRKKGVEDVDEVLRLFWETKMIYVLQDDKGTEYFCLLSDFYIDKIFPRYAIDGVRDQFRTKSQNTNVLLKSLDLLKEEFNSIGKSESKKSKAPAK